MSKTTVQTQQLTPFGAALAGALGACFSNAVVYPLDVAKTRIQASHGRGPSKATGVLPLVLRILKEEGIAGCFKGFWATMLNTFSMQYAYFFFYSVVRGAYLRRRAAQLPKGARLPVIGTAAELLLGALAGALAQVFTIPVSVIATRQQVGRSGGRSRVAAAAEAVVKPGVSFAQVASAPPAATSAVVEREKPAAPTAEPQEETDDSFLGVAREIIAEEGVTGLWLGIQPGLVLTVNPAITYGAYERIKGLLLGASSVAKLSPGKAFVVGAFSKTLATVVTYPYIMAKVRIQARTADSDAATEAHTMPPPAHAPHHKTGVRHDGALDILGRILKKEGPLGWYQGMGAQVLKAVLSQGVLFMSKDQFERWALVLMATLYRLQRS